MENQSLDERLVVNGTIRSDQKDWTRNVPLSTHVEYLRKLSSRNSLRLADGTAAQYQTLENTWVNLLPHEIIGVSYITVLVLCCLVFLIAFPVAFCDIGIC